MRLPPDPLMYPPCENSLHDPPAGQTARRPRPSRVNWWMGVLILACMFAVVAVPVLYHVLPRELDRWHMALAVERRLEGDLEGAVQSLNRVIDSSPDNDELLRQRAEWRTELKDFEAALADANRAVELNARNAWGYFVRSQIYQHLDRHDEALADWKTLVEEKRGFRRLAKSSLLNGRAYARAIAGQQLDEALEDVQQAIEISAEEPALLDTRGFIQLLRGETDSALRDMERAVELAELHHESWSEMLQTGRPGVLDLREFKLDFARNAESVAVIRYHRSLVYDELGESSKAEEDRLRVRELGFEPNEDLF